MGSPRILKLVFTTSGAPVFSPKALITLYKVIKAFGEKTGAPLVVNTSFNIRGEPIVNTPEDAYRCFMFTDMDALVLQNCVLLKEKQPVMPGADEYKKKFIKQD